MRRLEAVRLTSAARAVRKITFASARNRLLELAPIEGTGLVIRFNSSPSTNENDRLTLRDLHAEGRALVVEDLSIDSRG